MQKAAFIGIAAVILSLLIKGVKSEYSIYISIAAIVLIFGFSTGSIEMFISFINKLQDYAHIPSEYIKILLKIAAITYISEISASICADAGFSAVAGQIEFIGRMSIMAAGMPVVFSIIELLENVFNM